MKKLMIGLLTAMTIVGMSVPVFASDISDVDSNLKISSQPMEIAANMTNDTVNYLLVGGKNINIGNLNVVISNGKVMVPLKATAESLGFNVSIDKDGEKANLDNYKIKTQIQVGDDSYYYESSKAIGMTAPEKLGEAPIIVDNNMYVPIKIYTILFNDSNNIGSFWSETKEGQLVYVDKGELTVGWKLINNKWYFMDSNGVMQNGWVQTNGNWYYLYDNGEMASDTITPDGYNVDVNGRWDFGKKVSIEDTKIGMPSPIEEFKTIADAQKVLKFNVTVPNEIPSEYNVKYISTISKELFQICYSNGKNEILYRMGQGIEKIDGDYNNYKNTDTIKVDGNNIKLNGNGDLIKLATWSVNDMSYSISISNGMSKEDIIDIIENQPVETF